MSQTKSPVELDDLPVVPSSKLTEREEQLIARFDEIDLKSIENLTDGGKRLVEWGTAAVGIFFAAFALLDNPTVLAIFGQTTSKILGVLAVIAYLLAIAAGFFASIPKRYQRRTYSITQMEQQLDAIFTAKNRLVVFGSSMFVLGTLALGFLILQVLSQL